jgi:hypothetical protein
VAYVADHSEDLGDQAGGIRTADVWAIVRGLTTIFPNMTSGTPENMAGNQFGNC